MSTEQVIRSFYEAFQKKDYQTMQKLYADDATFSDQVFVNLDSSQVRSMWEMLIHRGKDLQIEFRDITTEGSFGTVQWIATYTFSATRRKVVNEILAEFEIENDKIKSHRDSFDFYKWATQALGFRGRILGWTGFFKREVRKKAIKSLDGFSKEKK